MPPGPPPPPWSVRPDSPWASPAAQLCTFLTCATAIVIATSTLHQVGWGIATSFALGLGAIVSTTTPMGERFRSLPGAGAAILVGAAWFVLVGLLLSTGGIGGEVSLFAFAFLAAAFTLGLDWRRVDRLRMLPFASGFLVLIGIADGQVGSYVAGAAWLLLSFGTWALLEADRRGAVAPVAPLAPGPPGPAVAATDLATTVVVALAIAAIAALVLSVPSCQSVLHPNGKGLNHSSSSSGSGSQRRPGGNGSISGGTGSGSSGSSNDHTYQRDPNGDFLVPDPSGHGTSRIPVPPDGDLTGRLGRTEIGPDGSRRTYTYDDQGHLHLKLEDPDGTTHRFTYTPQPGGTTRIQEYDADGKLKGTYTYDPQGRIGDPSGTGSTPDSKTPDPKPPKSSSKLHLPDLRMLLLGLLLIAAVAGLVWWFTHRPEQEPEPDGPPWAVALARRIGEEGRKRGRPRAKEETIVAYSAALTRQELPDPRLAEVGRVVSAALFGAADPGAERRVWAESTLDAILADHPRDLRSRMPGTKVGASSGPRS